MRVSRRRATERLDHRGVARSARQQVVAADHVRDLHQHVVDRDREQEDGRAVGADQHEVAQLAARRSAPRPSPGRRRPIRARAWRTGRVNGRPSRSNALRSASVSRRHRPSSPPGGSPFAIAACLRRLRAPRPCSSSGTRCRPRSAGRRARGRCRCAATGGTGRAGRRRRGPRPNPGRAIASESSTPWIRLLGDAAGVGVLDAQHERAPVVPGEQPAEQRGPRVPHVDRSGRRGSEPAADGVRHLRHHGVRERADALDLDLDDVAVASRPTPSGVPVNRTSPGRSVMNSVMYSISSATPNTMSDVCAACRISPFRRVSRRMSFGIELGLDPRPERARAVEPLRARPLIVHASAGRERHVVRARVAEDVSVRVLGAHAPRQPPDDHGQLALVVDALADRQELDRIARVRSRPSTASGTAAAPRAPRMPNSAACAA